MTQYEEHMRAVAALILSIILLLGMSWYLGRISSSEEIANFRSGIACIIVVFAGLTLYSMSQY